LAALRSARRRSFSSFACRFALPARISSRFARAMALSSSFFSRRFMMTLLASARAIITAAGDARRGEGDLDPASGGLEAASGVSPVCPKPSRPDEVQTDSEDSSDDGSDD
jgi:hypothetical protein